MDEHRGCGPGTHEEGKREDSRGGAPALPSPQSERGLDWLNFFMADVQTGFGSFVSFYLADQGWSQAYVGFALTAGGITGVAAQIPGGALTDALRRKRVLVAIGTAMIVASALLLALWPSVPIVFAAEILHGATGGIIGPAIAAISMGLVGRRAMSRRVGRNHRFDAAGNALTAGCLGLIGHSLSTSAIFLAVAALTVPTFVALARIRPQEIAYGRARNAVHHTEARDLQRLYDLLRNRGLIVFSAALTLFQFADASMLPLVSERLGSGQGGFAALYMAATIIVPQVIVGFAAPWVGHYAEEWGRKPLLLIGLAVEPIRGVLFAFSIAFGSIMAAQILDGISGAIMSVMTVLVIADLTTGTGRFNLARGAVGTCTGIAAAVSTTATGVIATHFGAAAAFLVTAAAAAAAVLVLWFFLPESKPQHYLD
ncbi:MAG TPA: MFS transporter [Stellaceae bacterium]|nr:MFS transporter [Stellaceae bacterium]